MSVKYILGYKGDEPIAIMFSDSMQHNHVWNKVQSFFEDDLDIRSAGFIRYGLQGWRTFSSSFSLGIGSDPVKDNPLFNRIFQIDGFSLYCELSNHGCSGRALLISKAGVTSDENCFFADFPGMNFHEETIIEGPCDPELKNNLVEASKKLLLQFKRELHYA